MPSKVSAPCTEGAASFDPDAFLASWDDAQKPGVDGRLDEWIAKSFNVQLDDGYVYHATAAVTLPQVQQAINVGGRNGMHAWYRDVEGKPVDPPPPSDITAYTSIFSPKTSTDSALKALASNAKKGSLRAAIATHLLSNYQSPAPESGLRLPAKQKTSSPQGIKNPAYDVWSWTCQNLEWAGPEATTTFVRQSHHILPILYHHFGCVCPSWDALSLIDQLCKLDLPKTKPPTPPRPIIEIGSGNGYWASLLRKLGLNVIAVDNALSAWRTTWIGDTIITDGIKFLTSPPPELAPVLGGKGSKFAILLLVYPQVSNDFTGRVIRAYAGDTIVVAGTQNGNGFTGFRDETILSWMAREKKDFELVVQVPLPSFAAKDEAFFVFRRRKE